MAQKFDLNEKTLAQVRPSGTGLVTLYEMVDAEKAVAKQLEICNVGNGNETFSLHLDADGLVFDDTNALYKNHPIKRNETVSLDGKWWPIDIKNAGFGIQASTANVLVFTLTGFELEQEA